MPRRSRGTWRRFVDRSSLARAAREQRDATRALREPLRLDGVVGRSPALAAVLEQACSSRRST